MKIVVPLDGSELSESALPWASALAQHLKASVLAVRVVDPFVPGSGGSVPSLMVRLHEDEISNAEKYLKARVPEGWEVATKLGSPRTVLGDLASSGHCQAVIMASHGRSGGARWLLGSVAEGVLRQSKVPVLLLRPIATSSVAGPFRRVLIPLDGSPAAVSVMERVKPWLAADAHVWLVQASGFDLQDRSPLISAEERQTLMDSLDAELAEVPAPGLTVTRMAVDGEPANSIVALAEEYQCDLVAMSTHGRSGWTRFLLGSVTEKVARSAPCPVLAFPWLDANVAPGE